MAWIYLAVGGLLEVVWATAMKYTEGFTRLLPSLVTVAAMLVSLWMLSLAMKTIPLGTAYGVWTGIGAVGSVLVGMFLLGEPRDALRLLFVAMIIGGIVGLKVTSRA